MDLIKGTISNMETTLKGNFLTVFEKLNTKSNKEAKPFVCYQNQVIFYRSFNDEIDRTKYSIYQHYHDCFYEYEEIYYLYCSSKAIWHNEAWHMKHLLIKRNPNQNGN